MSSSPFVVGQWVRGEKFYGRATLIDEILKGPRSTLWVLGTRRIGKTSLLKQIEHLTADSESSGYCPIFWDFQGADSLGELQDGFGDALLDAEERLTSFGVDTHEIEGKDLFDSIGRLRRMLRAKRCSLLLLCDEVEELITLSRKNPALLRKLRRMMQSHEGIRCVLASTIRLWELAEQRGDTSPFLHGFTPPLYIHGLSDDEARALIRQGNLPSDSRPTFDEETVEQVRIRCDNHPYLIQLVCKRYQELGNLVDAVEQVATDPMVSYFFAVDFEMLSDVERSILQVIAETSAATSATIQGRMRLEEDELTGNLLRLEYLGYIRRNAERRFELINYFFGRWFKERPHRDVRLDGSSLPPDQRPTVVSSEVGLGIFDKRYNLIDRIGDGATGVVYKARDEVLGETIAIKVLRVAYTTHSEIIERFRREVLLARDLTHPNILKIYHFGECDGRRYLTMKWVDGSTLSRVLSREGALEIERAIDLSWKLASALEAAHALEIIHRDIKPSNILLDELGEPFLCDFGLARLMNSPSLSGHGMFLGTPDYASPEQARLLPSEERSDLYSLGLVIFEMAAGRRPFLGGSYAESLEMHRSTPAPDPRQFRREIPPGLSQIILRCLQKDPQERYPSAGALHAALAELR